MIFAILVISALVTFIALGLMMFLGWPKSDGLAGLIMVVVFACTFGAFHRIADECFVVDGAATARQFCEVLDGE